MTSMLDPDKFNKDVRERQLKTVFDGMGPLSEKSVFILAMMIMQQPNPADFNNHLISTIDALYNSGGNTDMSVGSTYSELSTMRQQAWSLYIKIQSL